MKKKKQIFMLLLALLVGLPLSAQSKQEKKEQKKEAIKKLIASENYKIDVRLSPTCLISDGPTVSRMVEVTDSISKLPLKNMI